MGGVGFAFWWVRDRPCGAQGLREVSVMLLIVGDDRGVRAWCVGLWCWFLSFGGCVGGRPGMSDGLRGVSVMLLLVG